MMVVVEEEAVAGCFSQSGLGSRGSGDGLEFREKKLKPQMIVSDCSLRLSKHPSVDPQKSRAGYILMKESASESDHGPADIGGLLLDDSLF